MDHHRILFDIAIISVIILIVQALALRFKLPTVIALLLGGATAGIFGPHGMQLLGSGTETLVILAEVGVGFLMLPIPIEEFTLDRLWKMKRQILLGGLLQLTATTVVSGLCYAWLFQGNWSVSIFVGLLTTMSSTVIVIERLEERGKLHTAGGQLAVGILIFQDVSLLPIALLTPALRSGGGFGWVLPLLFASLLLLGGFLPALKLVNPFLKWAESYKDRSFVFLCLTVICLLTVVLCAVSGLSPAFGMFLAGILISRTDYRYDVLSIAQQIKKLFGPLHFVSFGLLIDYALVAEHGGKILASALGLIALKLFSGILIVLAMGYRPRTACKVAGSLAHIGELSFVLAAIGAHHGVITEEDFRVFVVIAIASIFFSPFVMSGMLKVADRIPDIRLFGKDPLTAEFGKEHNWIGHVIIGGYGAVGRYAALALQKLKITVVVIDSDGERLEVARTDGCCVFLGEIDQATLTSAQVDAARAVILTFKDHSSRELAIKTVRDLAPATPLILRIRTHAEAVPLLHHDDLDVISGDAATAQAVVARARKRLLLPELSAPDLEQVARSLEVTN